MKFDVDQHFIMACDSTFKMTETLALKGFESPLMPMEQAIKLVAHESVSSFLDFCLRLNAGEAIFEHEVTVMKADATVSVWRVGGVSYKEGYILAFYSNFMDLFEALMGTENTQLEYLRLQMKKTHPSAGYYDQITALNNEITNNERNLYKQNAYVLELLKKQELANKELERVNDVKDRIFTIIGHDLRTPLSNIIESIEYIESGQFAYEEMRQMNLFSILKDSTTHTMLLLGNLLEWSKVHLGEGVFTPERFNLKDVMRQSVELLKPIALNKRIEIIEDFEKPIYVLADQRMMGVVIRNILSNAIKFTHEKGHIFVGISSDSDFAKVTVVDTGIGISSEMLSTLFDQALNNVVKGTKGETGTGFGLLLCKNMVEQNGGQMSITSKIGMGTKVAFEVPIAKT